MRALIVATALLLAQADTPAPSPPDFPVAGQEASPWAAGSNQQPAGPTPLVAQAAPPQPLAPSQPPAAETPSAQEQTQEEQLRSDETMQSMDQHLADIEQQEAEAQEFRREVRAEADRQAALKRAAERRLATYNGALDDIAGIQAALAQGDADQGSGIETLRKMLAATRADAQASAGQQEAVALDTALDAIARAEGNLAASDLLYTRTALVDAQFSLRQAVSAAGRAVSPQ